MAPPPPVLMDELIEEILLLFPPDNPASLVRAGLVCKSWQRIVSDPRFSRRFREFHRKPSMLGFFCNSKDDQTGADVARFVPTSTCPPLADRRNSRALDARHGRVLLRNTPPGHEHLVVWDPIMDEQQELPLPLEYLYRNCRTWNAAVLCAAVAGACDHLDCHGGPFLVVLSCIVGYAAYFFLYSSIIGSWSEPSMVYLNQYTGATQDVVGPSLLIGDRLHFPVGHQILTYVLATNKPSLITSPFTGVRNMALVAMATEEEGGGLGLGVAKVRGCAVRLCSQLRGLAGWKEKRGFVGLAAAGTTTLLAFAEGVDAVLVAEKEGVISVLELKSGRITEVCERGIHCYGGIVPYVSFCLPRSTGPRSQPEKMNLGN
ncbi:unnamed protein product [Urochloa humidicola]